MSADSKPPPFDAIIAEALIPFKAEESDLLSGSYSKLFSSLKKALECEFPAVQKTAQEEDIRRVRTKLQYFESIAELLPASLFAKDERGRYIYVNSNFVESAGWESEEQVLGKTSVDVFQGKRAEIARLEDREVLSQGVEIQNHENFHQGPGTEERWISVSKSPVRDAEGNIIGMVGMLRDIHNRKLAEACLKTAMEELESKNLKLERDLQLARGVQESLLPRTAECTTLNGLQVACSMRQYEGIGGDFLYLGTISENRSVAFICDVMGHGVQAALIASLIRGLVFDVLRDSPDPGEFLTVLNHHFIDALRFHETFIFATALCLDFNRNTNLCRYASAGHSMPLLFRSKHKTVEKMCRPNAEGEAAIGLMEGLQYECMESLLSSEDSVLLYTDGIVEMLDANREELGEETLLEVFRDSVNLEASVLVSNVIEGMVGRGAGHPEDDLTLALLKVI